VGIGADADAEPLDWLRELFAGDTMLASQLYDLRKSAPSARPIQRLMLAVLGDAIDCLLSESLYAAYPSSARGRLRAEARRWLFDDAAARPFSFNWVCDGLGISASYLRAGIWRLEAQMHAKLGPSKGL
jgi:hypothetical protein